MSDYAAQRLTMVDTQVRANDVTDTRIHQAMLDVPRESFVPGSSRIVAYMEGCVTVGQGRVLLDARCFAKLAQLAAIRSGDTVLDVACATGYSSAVLARLARHVIGLEQDAQLARAAAKALKGVANAQIVQGTLAEGLPDRAPFDVIFMNGSAEHRPETLLAQLKEGGRLVCVMREPGGQGHATLFVKSDHALSDRIAFDADVPVLPGFERAPGFVF